MSVEIVHHVPKLECLLQLWRPQQAQLRTLLPKFAAIEMSGAKRKGGFRKGVEDDYINSLPLPQDGEQIVQVLGARGDSIFEIALKDEEVAAKASDHLALLPSKYRNVIWIKTRDFLIVDGGVRKEEDEKDAAEAGSKVQFIVKAILNKKQIKHIKKSGKWPSTLAADVGTGRADTTYADDYAGMDMGMGIGEDGLDLPSTSEKEA